MSPAEFEPAEHLPEATTSRRTSPLLSPAVPVLVAVIGVTLSLLVGRYFASASEGRNRARFERAAQHVRDTIEKQFHTYETLLRGGAGLLASNPDATEEEFRTYVTPLQLERLYPGVRGIGFARRTTDASGDHYPVVLLEPRDERNLRSLGSDLYSESARRAAMDRARDEADAAATESVILRQEPKKDPQPGFLVYVPVYKQVTAPSERAQRRADIIGFLYAPFRAGDFLTALFAHEATPDVEFELYDGLGTARDDLLFQRGTLRGGAGAFEKREVLQIAGVPWTLVTRSSPEFDAAFHRETPTEIAFVGALFSLALSGITFALQRTQVRAARHERQIRVTFASIADGIIVTDAQGRVTLMNRAAESLTGWREPEAQGLPLDQILKLADAENLRPITQPAQRVLQTGEAAGSEGPVLAVSSGEKTCPVEVRAAPIRHREGRLLGVTMTIRDVTEQRRAELLLRASEARNRAILDSALDPIVTVDQDGLIVGFNPAAERTFGYRQDEAVTRKFDEALFPPESRSTCRRWLTRFAIAEYESGSGRRVELAAQRADGTRFPCELTVVMTDVDRAPPFFTAYLHDITDRAEARDKLQAHATELEQRVTARTEELSESNEQLEALASSIAHDLRSPLRGLQGHAQLLLEESASRLDGESRLHLERIHEGARFMDQLILDLLNYGRLSREQLTLESVDLDEIWRAVLFQSQHRIDRTAAVVRAAGPWPMVRAHPPTLTQVLANLLSNSLKFVATGVRPEVTFRAEPRDGAVRLWMQDNGIGIPPSQREKIFGVFVRLNGSLYPGTGIGLSLVKKGVERMGGSVGFDSEPGRGTSFWVDLPSA